MARKNEQKQIFICKIQKRANIIEIKIQNRSSFIS